MSMAESLSQGKVGVTGEELKNLISMQALMTEANPLLKGERGASLINKMNSAVQGGGAMIDVMLGKGTKYQGLEGMWELRQAKEKGFADPENAKSIMSWMDKNIKGTEKEKMEYMAKIFESEGVQLTSEEIYAIFSQKDRMKSGNWTKKDWENISLS